MTADLSPLLYWIKERDALKLRKASGVPQEEWTTDPILKQYRFCNVRRRDDRVSQWLIEHVLNRDWVEGVTPDFLLFTALCRHINWPPTISAIMDAGLWPRAPLDLKAIGALVDRLGKTQKVWTGAYMVRADPGTAKGRFVAEHVVGGLAYATDILAFAMCSLPPVPRRVIHSFLCHHSGWGSFMAGQVVDDWTWTPLLSAASDLYTWAPIGPGSARGFNRLMGRPLTARVPEQEWDETLPLWRLDVIKELGDEYVNLTAMDLQNCLCETDKYLRVKNGEGRPRATYRPETEF